MKTIFVDIGLKGVRDVSEAPLEGGGYTFYRDVPVTPPSDRDEPWVVGRIDDVVVVASLADARRVHTAWLKHADGKLEPIITNCTNCRHRSQSQRPRIVDATGFGDQMEFADDDETVYSCKAAPTGLAPWAGKEVGVTPVHCLAWQAPVKARTPKDEEMDRLTARAEARLAAAEKERR